MSFAGELKTLPLPDILDWIARRMKTGRLELKRKSTEKRLTFRAGQLHSSFSNDPRETLGQALVREGLIKEEQLFTALLRQEKEGKRLGQLLIGDGLLGEEELKRTLRQNAVEIVYELFLWPDGLFEFREEDIPADLRISLDIEIPYVLEGLLELGALVVAEPTGRGDGSDPVGAIQALLDRATKRMKEGRYKAALEAYEAVLALDFLNQEAKKGLLAVGEARTRERIARQVPLEKVPVLLIGSVALTQQQFDSHEGFVLSRINGQWDVRSILKLCPMPELDALSIFVRLIDRKIIELQ